MKLWIMTHNFASLHNVNHFVTSLNNVTTLDSGLRSLCFGLWGIWTLHPGLWILDAGFWTAEEGGGDGPPRTGRGKPDNLTRESSRGYPLSLLAMILNIWIFLDVPRMILQGHLAYEEPEKFGGEKPKKFKKVVVKFCYDDDSN